jgi:hypothetical protein
MLLIITENGEVRIYPLNRAVTEAVAHICRKHGYNGENARAYFIVQTPDINQALLADPLYVTPLQLDINNILHPDKQTMPIFGAEADPC